MDFLMEKWQHSYRLNPGGGVNLCVVLQHMINYAFQRWFMWLTCQAAPSICFFVKVCAGAVICNAPCARSQLSCSKAPNRVIKGVIYTPISRPWRRQGGSLSSIREERRAILRDAHLIAAKGQRVQGEAVTHYSLQVFRIYFLPRLLLC